MFVENDIYISPKFTRRDYVKLDLNLNSLPGDWNKAVSILKDRICGRYLDPINNLICVDPNINGFAAMALMCLLIDTFMQFRFGLPQSESKKCRYDYVKFMSEHLGFDDRDSNRFYSDIRCGILHSAETKNGSYLDPVDNNNVIQSFLVDSKFVLRVSVQGLYYRLDSYFRKYCNELIQVENEECRRNFVTKMDDITLKYDVLHKDYELWVSICNNVGKEIRGLRGIPFTYYTHYEQVIINRELPSSRYSPKIKIPFSDIKRFIYSKRRREAYTLIENWWYIQSILNESYAEVERYLQDGVA